VTLKIEVIGNGTTDPAPGWFHFPKIGVCVVEALPDPDWMLDHWVLDEAFMGSDNPFAVDLDSDHNLTAVFVETPPELRELIIEIIGSGTTDPPAGSHLYAVSETVNVTAFPANGWVLDHWLLDSVYLGPENPIPVTMNINHVLAAIFVETPPAQVTIESCNLVGDQKDYFELGETVFVRGSGFSPSTVYGFYIVVEEEIWTDGMPIPERVPGTEPSILSNADGDIDPTDMWHDPQVIGNYDIVVDVNSNGHYDAGIDALDDYDVEVTAGFSVIPELSSILPLFMIATLIAGIVYRKKMAKSTSPLELTLFR